MSQLGIVIVHYRAETLLAKCLRRLASSREVDFEAVVVDNGSSGALEVPHSAGTPDPRFRVVEAGSNPGFAAGTNLGLEQLEESAARPPLVLLMNPDVLVERDTLATMVHELETHPEISAATCRLELPAREGEERRLDPACRRTEPTVLSAGAKFLGLSRVFPRSRTLGRYNLTWIDPDRETEIDACSGAFLLVRRQALDRIGGRLDERFFLYGEDLDLCRRIRETGGRLRYFPTARALHVKGSGRIRDAGVTFEFYRAMWTYYRKWGRFRRQPVVLLFLLAALALLGCFEAARNALRSALVRNHERLVPGSRAAARSADEDA